MHKWDVDFAELSKAPSTRGFATAIHHVELHAAPLPQHPPQLRGCIRYRRGSCVENRLNPKLPNNDCNQSKRQLSHETSLTEGETEGNEDNRAVCKSKITEGVAWMMTILRGRTKPGARQGPRRRNHSQWLEGDFHLFRRRGLP